MNIIRKHPELFSIIGLGVLCYFIFFHGIGTYALMDVDETRYAAMARDMFLTKDFLTLKLNGDFFFEKPPLYFWGECLSFWIFGKINEFTVRFPCALYGTLSTFLLYFVGKKIVGRTYGILAALILATSLEFTILSKFAILDIVVSASIGFSVMFGFMTFFCAERNKKYFWWLFYVFSALAVMAKGVPGVVVPFGTMFFASIVMKLSPPPNPLPQGAGGFEAFRPQYFLVGMMLFLLIVLPWHIVMLKMHGQLFWDEYVIKHHLQRFTGSETINRAEPWYFYILTFLWGFFPWILPAIALCTAKLIKLKQACPPALLPSCPLKQFVLLNAIGFTFTFLFFSASGTKLITYILPVYFFSACITAYFWRGYIEEEKYKKPLNAASYVLFGILLAAAIAGLLTPIFLSEQLYKDIFEAKWALISVLTVCGLTGIVSVMKNYRKAVFALYVLLMLLISAFLTDNFFKIDYKFGQDDLMEYAKLADEKDYDLVSFGFGRRYSLLYYYDKNVEMEITKDIDFFKKKLAQKKVYIIVRNKNLEELSKQADFQVVEKGRKYSLIKKK